MPDTLPPEVPPTDGVLPAAPAPENNPRVQPLNIEVELKDSYLSYAMSVIVSRALPDVRDGLKPSQRRILVAMNDLGLSPTSPRAKCAKIAGEIDDQAAFAFRHRFQELECSSAESNSGVEAQGFGRGHFSYVLRCGSHDSAPTPDKETRGFPQHFSTFGTELSREPRECGCSRDL